MSLVMALTVTGMVPVLRRTNMFLPCHSTVKSTSGGAGFSASAILSTASRCRVAFTSALSAASRAFSEAFECHQENRAPMMVKTAHTALTMAAAVSMPSSPVRRAGGPLPAGATHLTGEEPSCGAPPEEGRL